jgi:ABC-type nitrate/sulfonate/bicarbonate transport system ATPase subunit
VLKVDSLTKSYPGGRTVLKDISFSIAEGETLSVVGPSGCGKTTLLYLLCGLLRPDSGVVRLSGRPVTRPLPEMAIILQDYGLLPWKSVLSNVALGLKIQGVSKRDREARGRAALEAMGLSGRERDYPACLSGGERQRVAIARAYASGPRVLLMDEPFSSLDALTREKLQDLLLSSRQGAGVPWILVTHSVEEAVYLGRRIMVMAGSPATLVAGFENPDFGISGHRESEAFFQRVRMVRRCMEQYW